LLKAAMPRHFGFIAFAATQVVIDVETLYHLVRREWPLHRILHTYFGATVVGAVVGVAAFAVGELLIKWWKRDELVQVESATVKPRAFRRNAALLGGMIGGMSHVLLDSIMHQDIQPLWPFTKANEMLGAVNLVSLHRGCVIAGLVGLAIMFVNRIPRTTE
jgi:hypothetical protein